MSYYHYTKGCHLESIVKEGRIRTSSNLLDKVEIPAAWLTKSPNWEIACNVGLISNINELKIGKTYSSEKVDQLTSTIDYMKKEIGMSRILVSENLPTVSWAKFKHVSGISERIYRALDNHSKSKACAVDSWLCTFTAIPKKYWEGIELFVDDKWVRWDEKIPINEFVDLCMSCNNNQYNERLVEKVFPEHYYKESAFIDHYRGEIIEFWEANKHKKGYIEIFIDSDYQPYKCGFQFVKKRVKRSSFMHANDSKFNNCAFVHFLWEATYTKYKIALALENEVYEKSL